MTKVTHVMYWMLATSLIVILTYGMCQVAHDLNLYTLGVVEQGLNTLGR